MARCPSYIDIYLLPNRGFGEVVRLANALRVPCVCLASEADMRLTSITTSSLNSNGNALRTVSVCGHEKIVQILVDGRVEVNARGEYGNALFAASAYGHEKA